MSKILSNPFMEDSYPKSRLESIFWVAVMFGIGAILGIIVVRLIH